jgi:hypothetical protein
LRLVLPATLALVLLAWPVGGAASLAGQVPRERVLFIGNSLTTANDLPGIVRALAEASGGPAVDTAAIVADNFSLEDHWHDGAARRAIARGGWTSVVLQQGPSALPESQRLLIEFTRRFHAEIRGVGARTALYMVWPSRARAFDFDDVVASYAAAAKDVDGLLLPAGDAWQEAWKLDSRLALYGQDGFHPSLEGSYLSAIVVYQGLSGRAVADVPRRLVLAPGRVLSIDDRTAGLFQQAALAVRPVR